MIKDQPDFMLFVAFLALGLLGIIISVILTRRRQQSGRPMVTEGGIDIATIVGLMAATTMFLTLVGPPAPEYLSAEGLVIVLGGSMAVTLIGHPLQDVVGSLGTMRLTFLPPPELPRRALLKLPKEQGKYADLDKPLLTPAEQAKLVQDLQVAARVTRNAGRYGMASGIIGALCLVVGWATTTQPAWTPEATVALLPLLYGTILCEWICRPLANKMDRLGELLLQGE